MGNSLEKTVFTSAESSAASTKTVRRPSANQAPMDKEEDEDAYYLSETERNHLQTIYGMIYINRDGQPDAVGLRAALANEPDDLIVNTLLSYLQRKKISSYKQFEHYVIQCARISGRQTIEILWEMAEFAGKEEDDARNSKLFKLCRLLLLFSGDNLTSNNDIVPYADALVNFYHAVSKRNDPTENIESNTEQLVGVINEFSAHSARAFQTYIGNRWLLAADSPTFKPYLPVQLTLPSEILNPYMLPLLAMYGEEFQSSWKRLYSTYSDGLSFNRIAHHILGYDGPTLIVIKTSSPPGCIFGAFTVDRWKESNKFFGSSRTTLFTIHPKFRIFRTKPNSNGSYQWLNEKSFGLPHGLGIGGTLEGFRLFITEGLEKNTARDMCPTFEEGKLIPTGEEFEIDALEVWGCGGASRVDAALKAREHTRQVMAENIQKARKVDKAAFFDSSFDREFLLGNTFAHHKEKQERLEEY